MEFIAVNMSATEITRCVGYRADLLPVTRFSAGNGYRRLPLPQCRLSRPRLYRG